MQFDQLLVKIKFKETLENTLYSDAILDDDIKIKIILQDFNEQTFLSEGSTVKEVKATAFTSSLNKAGVNSGRGLVGRTIKIPHVLRMYNVVNAHVIGDKTEIILEDAGEIKNDINYQ